MHRLYSFLTIVAGLALFGLASTTSGCSCSGKAGGRLVGYGAQCDTVTDCGGETPICGDRGFCVECQTEADCNNQQVCSRDGFCGECATDEDCPTIEPFCDAERRRCMECQADRDCGTAEPVCDPRGECVPACEGNAVCETGDICILDQGFCAECARDPDCPAGRPLCDPDTFRCEECLGNDDCATASPYCINGRCEECIQNLDCGAAGVCDADLECVTGCQTDADCTDGGLPFCDTDRRICAECITDLNCGGGDPACVNFRCEECAVDSHCDFDPALPVCIGVQCEECRTDSDCATGQTCNNNNECRG
ncbi:MAG: hypothetical protein P1V51_06670 [Deltaproteobacteria bacterium]|nr:hypothetical protein [Deltaproteobacteria bacterium]